MSSNLRTLVVALALSLLSACDTVNSIDFLHTKKRPRRAIWVTRFDYRTESDVVEIMEQCESLGLDTILFQVRGNATAFYPSAIEPWAAELGGEDPGFDPLAVALTEAGARGLRLHAWVNVMPAWWGTTPPADPEQLYNKHPEWLWYDQNGDQQALSDRFYVSVNPCLPEVREYIVDVLRDLVAHYDIDGLHLDYMRFPNEPPGTPAGSGLDYPHDEQTLMRFLGSSGQTPEDAPKAWDEWRTEKVTYLLRDIRNMIGRTRPLTELSVAVGPDPVRAREEHFQDVTTWVYEGLVDRVYPMNYTGDPDLFMERLANWKELAPADQVVMGIRVESGSPLQVQSFIESTRAELGGFCLFAYQSLFDGPNVALVEQDPEARRQRAVRRLDLAPFLRTLH